MEEPRTGTAVPGSVAEPGSAEPGSAEPGSAEPGSSADACDAAGGAVVVASDGAGGGIHGGDGVGLDEAAPAGRTADAGVDAVVDARTGRLAEEMAALRAETEAVRSLTEAVRHEVEYVRGLAEEMRAEFDAKIRYDEVKERQVTHLHEEVQAHRAGLHLRLLRPLFDDLVRMHDDIADLLRSRATEQRPGPAGDDDRADAAAETLESLRESIVESLSRGGVAIYSTPGDEVDRARQRVIRLVATDDPALDRQVAGRLRAGFEYDGKVLRPEWVEVYRYVPSGDSGSNHLA